MSFDCSKKSPPINVPHSKRGDCLLGLDINHEETVTEVYEMTRMDQGIGGRASFGYDISCDNVPKPNKKQVSQLLVKC